MVSFIPSSRWEGHGGNLATSAPHSTLKSGATWDGLVASRQEERQGFKADTLAASTSHLNKLDDKLWIFYPACTRTAAKTIRAEHAVTRSGTAPFPFKQFLKQNLSTHIQHSWPTGNISPQTWESDFYLVKHEVTCFREGPHCEHAGVNQHPPPFILAKAFYCFAVGEQKVP